jgi:hypothetical protein
MAQLEPSDDHAPRPITPPVWWWRTDRGPTTAELRTHVLEQQGEVRHNSACRGNHPGGAQHELCPGTVYVGHVDGSPAYEPCLCRCHE